MIEMLVSKGYGDVRFDVGGEEVEGVKSLICSKNQTLASIINDEKVDSVIPIYERIKMNSFKMLLRYYSYGKIILTNENVCNLLYCCLCYNEIDLSDKCKEYILNHLSIELVISLLENLETKLIDNDKGEFQIKVESFIRDNSVKILSEPNTLSLSIEALEYINSVSHVVEKEGGFSLQNISKYYNNIIGKVYEKKQEKLIKNIKELNNLLDKNYIDYKKINEEDMKISIDCDLQSFVTNSNLLLYARSYLDIPMPFDEKIGNIIMKLYSTDILPIELKEDDKNTLKSCSDLNECLLNLMKKDNHGLKLGLLIVIDCGINIEMDERTKYLYEYHLMSEYIESKKENEKILCSKCLCYFADKSIIFIFHILEETMDHIKIICGNDIIETMKSICSILPDSQKDIIESY